MATRAITGQQKAASTTTRPKIQGLGFDCVAIFTFLWLLTGGYFDSWAHFHIAKLETFFTIWHAALYSGVFAVLIVQVGVLLLNRLRGYSWTQAVPEGYELSLLGVIGFFIAGIGDMIWHILFGIEKSIDAQFSPTHVAIMVCFVLITTGLYRVLYRRATLTALQQNILLPISLALFMLCMHLIVTPIQPYVNFWPSTVPTSEQTAQTLAVVGFLLYSMVLSMLNLYTVRRWHLSFGTYTFAYTVAAIPLSFLQDHPIVIAIALITGLLTDTAYHFIKPSLEHPDRFRLFIVLASVIYYSVYFLTLLFTSGVVWTVHMSVGTIVGAGLLTLLLTYMVIPSQRSEAE